jgi:hypothetical protein
MTDALDIVIVNYNTRADLAACLRSLHEAPPTRPHQIVVVDNASQDGSISMVRQAWPDVRVEALATNVGFAAANNVAIRRTGAPLILLLNSDTLVPPGTIDTLCDRLIDAHATAAGPRLIDDQGQPEVSFGAMLSPLAEALQAARVALSTRRGGFARWYVTRRTSRERIVDWISGACLLVRRDAAERAGLLDERYFMYEEDVDFCAALRADGGHILFTPRASVVHLRGRSIRTEPPTRPSAYDRAHLAFYAKHRPRWVPWIRCWKRLRGRL